MTAKDVRRKKLLRTIGLHFSGVDTLKALGMYLMSVMGCLLLRSFDMHNDTSYVAMIFLLDVFLTAFWTDGYLLGIIAAVVGVFSVDYIFTYPFWHISFTLTGFPLTFLVMMTISILTASSSCSRCSCVRVPSCSSSTLVAPTMPVSGVRMS